MVRLGASLGGDAQMDVILTPGRWVAVFICSMLEDLAAELAAARRAVRRLRLVRPGAARCRAGPSPRPGELERLLADGSVE